MNVLITGLTGFVGRYLAERIAAPGVVLYGLVRPGSDTDSLPATYPGLVLLEADLEDPAALKRAVSEARPDVVFHLAAATPVASSWDSPAAVFRTNAVGQINLFEELRRLETAPRTIVACSGEAYGHLEPTSVPVAETAPLRPISPYGASKAAQDMLAEHYERAYGLPTIRLRLFNHTGPGRPTRFAASSFARQIAEIEAGVRQPTIDVGNLDAIRDFTDVRDVARAYGLAAASGRAGAAYNVCSGRKTRVGDILDRLLSFSDTDVEVRPDPRRSRRADVPVLVGDPSRFKEATGWTAQVPLQDTLRDLLDWWRARLSEPGITGPA